MYVIIVGSGVVARALGDRLTEEGHQLAFVIDEVVAAEEMADRFPRALVIHGSGSDDVALDHARAQECDAFLAVDANESRAIVACLLARERFGVGAVAALATACEDVPAFSALSIANVCGPEVLADAILHAVDDRLPAPGKRR